MFLKNVAKRSREEKRLGCGTWRPSFRAGRVCWRWRYASILTCTLKGIFWTTFPRRTTTLTFWGKLIFVLKCRAKSACCIIRLLRLRALHSLPKFVELFCFFFSYSIIWQDGWGGELIRARRDGKNSSSYVRAQNEDSGWTTDASIPPQKWANIITIFLGEGGGGLNKIFARQISLASVWRRRKNNFRGRLPRSCLLLLIWILSTFTGQRDGLKISRFFSTKMLSVLQTL